MAILVRPGGRVDRWRATLDPLLVGEDVRWWPEVGDPSEIEYLVAWRMDVDDFAPLVNLQAILSLGAGTEQWQRPGIPDVAVVRLADPAMAGEMAAYAIAWVVHHQRRFPEAADHQRGHRWIQPDTIPTPDFHVGVLGYGEIGARIGGAFRDLGFAVNAWTRTRRGLPGVDHYVGPDELADFLGASHAVVNVLPSTSETIGVLTPERLDAFRAGSLFVNIGRGTVLSSEDDLIAALDRGRPAAAVLDVTDPEPPSASSPLFDHPAVTLTAHTSGLTQIATAAPLIAANLRRLRAGDTPFPLLDRRLGY